MEYRETAKRLSDTLHDLRMKPAELSRLSGVSEPSISHYLSGRHEPSTKTARAMAKVLMVDPLWLMGLDVPATPIAPIASVVSPKPAIMLDADLNEEERIFINAYRESSPTGRYEALMALLKGKVM